VILRRRDDLARVMRDLGGTLFATEGQVDSYFNLNHCDDRLEDGRGQVFLCSLPKGHAGAHENENMEWWNEESNELTIHPRLVSGSPWPIEGKKLELHVTDEINWKPLPSTEQLWRIQHRIDEHIRTAPERESAALRRANIRQACHVGQSATGNWEKRKR
jgi:hypothetical protein